MDAARVTSSARTRVVAPDAAGRRCPRRGAWRPNRKSMRSTGCAPSPPSTARRRGHAVGRGGATASSRKLETLAAEPRSSWRSGRTAIAAGRVCVSFLRRVLRIARTAARSPGQAGSARVVTTPRPGGDGAVRAGLSSRPAVSWPRTKGKVPRAASVGDGPVLSSQ